MYKCEYCGHVFEEGQQAVWYESHGFARPPYEEVEGCPICKESFVEIKPCKICGGYDHEPDEEYCEDCIKDVGKRFRQLVNANFTETEKDLLNEILEGEGI